MKPKRRWPAEIGRTDGTSHQVLVDLTDMREIKRLLNPNDPTLMLEVVSLPGAKLYIDEAGLLKNLPVNVWATGQYLVHGGYSQIMGDILLVSEEAFQEAERVLESEEGL